MKITVSLFPTHVEAVCTGTRHNTDLLEQQAIDAVAYDPDAGVFSVRTDAFDHTWMCGTKATITLKGAL